MLHKTKSIILSKVKYNDKSYILHTYTELFGRVTYSLSPSHKGSLHNALFFPISVLEMDVDHQATKEIQRIKDAKPYLMLNNVASDPVKNAIAYFIAEVLFRFLQENDPNEQLFDFIVESVRFLDESNESVANFHLLFLVHLTFYLGFYPNWDNYVKGRSYLNRSTGNCETYMFHGMSYVDVRTTDLLYEIAHHSYLTMSSIEISRAERKVVTDSLITYLQIHLNTSSSIKSLDVLKEIFD